MSCLRLSLIGDGGEGGGDGDAGSGGGGGAPPPVPGHRLSGRALPHHVRAAPVGGVVPAVVVTSAAAGGLPTASKFFLNYFPVIPVHFS